MKLLEKTMSNAFSKKLLVGIFFSGLLLQVTSLIVEEVFAGMGPLANVPLHAGIEMGGAVIALIVARVLLRMNAAAPGSAFHQIIAAGLIGMGLLDAMHAITPPGQVFVWLHSSATAVGGVLFLLVWAPQTWMNSNVANNLPIVSVLIASIGGGSAILYPDLIPEMLVAGTFTMTAKVMNFAGGLGMLLAAYRLFQMHWESHQPVNLLFSLLCLLFGSAAVMFEQSHLWDIAWWAWHVLRLMAYLVSLRILLGYLEHTEHHRKTELDQLNSALQRDQSALLSTLNMHAIVSVADRGGRITEVNDAFCRISGYSREELIGQNHRIVNSGVQSEQFWLDMWADISNGVPWRGEVCNRARNGELYWVDTFIAPFVGDDGKVDRYISIRTEVTSRRRSQEQLESALREASALLSTLNMHAIVSVADRAGRITEVNDAFCRISGYSREELIGQNHRIVNSGVQSDLFWTNMWSDISSGIPWRSEVCNRAKSGKLYWVDTFVAPFIDAQGRIEKYISIRTDITQSKESANQLEVSLRDAAALLTTLNMHAIVSVADRAGRITEVNDAFCRISGYGRDELLGQNHRIVNSGQQPNAFWDAMWEDISNGTPWRGQVCNRAKNGELYWVDTFIAPFVGDSGRPEKYVSIRTDITAAKLVEKELVQASASAQDASRAKSQFLANMSHELRTPMNAVLGMLTLLRKTSLTSRQIDYAKKSETAARSLLNLLNEILDFSKIEAGKMVLDPHPFSVDKLLRDLSVILSSSVADKPVEVLYDIAAEVPDGLVGDSMRLQQVLINLCSNAVKFTSYGEVVISMEAVQRTNEAVTLRVGVRDSGIGIAAENQARIFSGFTQAEASTTRQYGGTGLGVVISHSLLGLMGSQLELDSELGVGSLFHFTITLPVALQAEATHTQWESQQNTPLRVLIVDENAMSRDVLQRAAQSLGWTVDVAGSGDRARALLQEVDVGTSYCAAFVHWQLPEMPGWQWCETILSQGLQSGMRFFLMGSDHGREIFSKLSESQQAQVTGFLTRPLTASMLLDAVSQPQGIANQDSETASPPGGALLGGLRLLLTEDNLNNQQVATELLEAEGAIVQIANNGQEAVDAIAAAQIPFDVVLMDLQMPVMDGLAAARHIRTKMGLMDLPIIAMTANAMPSDRADCMAAGMNDHVGKPFDLSHLVRAIRTQAGLVSVAEAPMVMRSDLAQEIKQAAQTAGVDIEAALHRLGGKQDVYCRMLNSFVSNLRTMDQELNSYVLRGEAESAKRAMHTLKGLAATLGAMALANEAAKNEKLIGKDASLAAMAVDEAKATIADVLPGLTLLSQTLSEVLALQKATLTPCDAPLDAARLTQLLRVLSRELENSDMAAINTMAKIMGDFGTHRFAPLELLAEAVSGLNFEEAISLCDLAARSVPPMSGDGFRTPRQPLHE